MGFFVVVLLFLFQKHLHGAAATTTTNTTVEFFVHVMTPIEREQARYQQTITYNIHLKKNEILLSVRV